jgi:C-terminal processing protease CtpA/Prc
VHKISRVLQGSAAERAGLRQGDWITRVNGQDVHTMPGGELGRLLLEITATTPVALHVRSTNAPPSSRFSQNATRVI